MSEKLIITPKTKVLQVIEAYLRVGRCVDWLRTSIQETEESDSAEYGGQNSYASAGSFGWKSKN